jgi:two-component system sensor histidine kinase KdpD
MTRGILQVYLGAAPGVGKTFSMLEEGRRLLDADLDVVVGLVETHGRAETARLTEGLELFPRRSVGHRGVTLDELDLDGLIARHPDWAMNSRTPMPPAARTRSAGRTSKTSWMPAST